MRRKETLAQMSPFARQAIRQDDDGPIPVRITFYPPDARRRDDDNMIGSFRAARDGIADALGVDDRRFRPHYFLPNRKSRAVWKSCLRVLRERSRHHRQRAGSNGRIQCPQGACAG